MTRHRGHIILATFGTTARSGDCYQQLETRVQHRFPESRICWSFTSATIRRQLLRRRSDGAGKPLQQLLQEISKEPEARVVVQSVHLCAGHEFHGLIRKIRLNHPSARLGLPLLCSPEDHRQLAHTLMPAADGHPDHALLLLGHGSSHPSWTTLPAFANCFQRLIGRRVYFAALEHEPDTGEVLEELASCGRSQVLVIPLLLAGGRHLQRDILGEGPHSWYSRLAARNLQISLHQRGLLELEGTAELFCNHIRAALTGPEGYPPCLGPHAP